MSFVHLHVHSEYSLLDGFSNIHSLVKRVHEMGMPAIALTDHGTMFGTIEFYNAAKQAGVKPVIGLEAYLAARGMQDRDAKLDKQSSHLLLLAENQTGYRNLLTIASEAQLRGFYYFPRIDREFLASHSEGLIATTGCMAAEIPRTLAREGVEAARKKLDWYYDVFGQDRFFIELQQHEIKELPDLNRTLLEMGERYKARYVATNDVHYINPEDWRLQDIMLAVQTGSVLTDDNRFRMTDQSYYLRTPEEMSTLFAEVPEALANTLAIADRCNVDLEPKGYHLPNFPVPEGQTVEGYLRGLCQEGLQRRYGARASDPKVLERLEYELDVIHKMGFDAYFLIVWDLCRYARQEGVWYNARGSAAGSMVAYTLDITLVEPIEHGLIFERFLNPGRISMPDIDLDFQDDKRTRIMEYCAHTYGDDKVAQIITFGTLGARAAIRDVGRVMDIPISEVDKVAKLIPNIPGHSLSIADALQEVPELKTIYSETDYLRELIDTASKMEGVVRNAGTHAAGVVIADRPIVDYIPLHRPTSGSEESPIKTVTQFEMGILDHLGLLKVDFLGLASLTVMQRACDLIRERHGVDLNLYNIPVEDQQTFEFISQGRTAGIFQLEGTGMTRWITQMKPRTLANVIAMVALYRPGPMDFIPQYIRRMHSEEEITYRHPALEPIFKETYGIPIYQEQLMFAAMQLAGYTASEADDLRKAISKKKASEIEKHRKMFIKGAVRQGIAEKSAREIFEDWENFARYGFNKSHAADYGVIAVQTAYLKAHYTVEYMTALLSASKNDTDKVAFYVADCRTMGIPVLPPDINASQWDFSVENTRLESGAETAGIRFGLGAIKNVGQNPVDLVLAARQSGVFSSVSDFIHRVDLRQMGRRALESLVRVGALNRFGPRMAMMEALDRMLAASASHFRAVESHQMSFFDAVGASMQEISLSPEGSFTPDRREMLAWEKELIGLYVSDHPLNPHLEVIRSWITHYSGQLAEVGKREKVTIAGLVVRVRNHQTRDGKAMAFVSLEDLQGSVELVVFPRSWDSYSAILQVDNVVLVEGKVDAESGDPKLLVDNVTPVEDLAMKPSPGRRPVPARAPASSGSALDSTLDESTPPDWDLGPPPWEDAGWDAAYPPQPDNAPIPPEPSSPDVEIVRSSGRIELRPAARVETSSEKKVPLEAAPAHLSTGTTGGTSPPNPERAEAIPQYIVSPSTVFAELPSHSEQPRMVTVILETSGDKQKDVRLLRCIHGALLSSPGRDRFAFHIYEGGKRFLLEFPNETTGISPELMDKLSRFTAEENIRVNSLKQ